MAEMPWALPIPLSVFPWASSRRTSTSRSVSSGRVLGRQHVAYRVRVRRAGRDYLVEQQAYYNAEGPRITWMRVLCSGYQSFPG